MLEKENTQFLMSIFRLFLEGVLFNWQFLFVTSTYFLGCETPASSSYHQDY